MALVVNSSVAAAAGPHGKPRPKVLLVLAHPDDETMVGATLGRLKERGIEVQAAVVTRGEGGKELVRLRGQGTLVRRSPPNPVALARRRTREMTRAAQIHGFSQLHWLSRKLERPSYPDQPLRDAAGTPSRSGREFLQQGSWDAARLKSAIASVAAKVEPTVVITMMPERLAGGVTHAHHQAVAGLVEELRKERRLGGKVKGIYGMVEHDWYDALDPKRGDVRVRRGVRSPGLGLTYRDHLQRGAAAHRSQWSLPKGGRQRAERGTVPGNQAEDALRPLWVSRDAKRNGGPLRRLLRAPRSASPSDHPRAGAHR